MSSTKREAEGEGADEVRLPAMPSRPELPDVPALNSVLPPRPSKVKQVQEAQGGSYNKTALASIAASAFITPIMLLAVGGYALDAKLKHSTYWFAGLGLIIGMAVGVNSLLRVLQKIED
ncbi:hypothetical protein LBMAG21_16860 [Armatimonadota bacterium]|nr:hypothetical protein LBMAG21_16860 [Armatimonadota bacterium]